MVGISSHWNKLGKKPVETLARREVTFLEWLHRKRLLSYTLVTEEVTIPNSTSRLESILDFVANPSSLEAVVPVMPSPTKKIMKMEHENRKPSSSSTRVAPRNFSSKRKVGVNKILPLEGVMNYFDNVINLSPPKQKRTTRDGDAKGRGLTVLSSQPSFGYANPTSSLDRLQHYSSRVPDYCWSWIKTCWRNSPFVKIWNSMVWDSSPSNFRIPNSCWVPGTTVKRSTFIYFVCCFYL